MSAPADGFPMFAEDEGSAEFVGLTEAEYWAIVRRREGEKEEMRLFVIQQFADLDPSNLPRAVGILLVWLDEIGEGRVATAYREWRARSWPPRSRAELVKMIDELGPGFEVVADWRNRVVVRRVVKP